MAVPAPATKTQILSAAYGLLYREGFARVSMDAIAEAAGVTKKTLYYHFPGKDELVAAVLDHQHDQVLVQMQQWGAGETYSAADFLSAIFVQLQSAAAEPDWLGSGFSRLSMELADLPDHPARTAAQEHKASIEAWLVKELTRLSEPDPEGLARHVMLLLEGCLSLMLIHRDTSYAGAAAQAVRQLTEARVA